MNTALVTGVFGMDAQNIIHILLEKGYKVTGTYRYSSIPLEERKKRLTFDPSSIDFVSMDITDFSGVARVINDGQYDLVFNLCAQSHVGESFRNPYYAIQVDGIGPLNILEAIRNHSPHTRLYQAGTSETFGHNKQKIKGGAFEQNSLTPREANSPYGAGKLLAHNLVKIYRDGYGIFAVNGTLFNHTHPGTRTPTFFERKVSVYVAQLNKWAKDNLVNLSTGDGVIHHDKYIESHYTANTIPKLGLGVTEGVYRDIGWSYDYMLAAFMMVTADSPKDYIVATGEAHSLDEILNIMFGKIQISNYKDFCFIDPTYVRPVDVPYLKGNAEEIRKDLGWQPTKTFYELMEDMVNYDLGT